MTDSGALSVELSDVTAGYGSTSVLRGINLAIAPGSLVGLLGPNGAGKTTLLRTISRITQMRSGRIILGGQDVTAWPPERIPSLRVAHVPEGRRMFAGMSVLDNLLMGAHLDRHDRAGSLESVYEIFPQLRERARQKADTLSGGQQQMVAIGRALMMRPRLLMLDEPSQGLSPLLVDEVLKSIRTIAATGVTVLLVEQNARSLFELISEARLMSDGVVTKSIPKEELRRSDALRQLLTELPGPESHLTDEEVSK